MSHKPVILFTCPICCNQTAHSAEKEIHEVSEVINGENFVCSECGEKLIARVSKSGKSIKLVTKY